MSLTAHDAFRVLGIVCSSEEDLGRVNEVLVKRQYRRLALKLHPDKNKGDPNSESKFNQLKMAHDALMNESRRMEFVQTMRAYIQRDKEKAGRDAEMRKLGDELERREAEWAHSQKKDNVVMMRERHRMLIEQLQVKRNQAARGQSSGGIQGSTLTGGPDDNNMSLDYWINFGLNETEAARNENRDRFSNFISSKLSEIH